MILSPRMTQIVAYEAIAVLQALIRFRVHCLSKDVVLFVDNQTIKSCLSKGRSRALDIHSIVQTIVSTVASSQSRMRVFWVPSSLNIADVPSRGMSLDPYLL